MKADEPLAENLPHNITPLRTTAIIRERCNHILEAVAAGDSQHFRLDLEKLESAADLVEQVTRKNYPELHIPYHSRWRHFEAGGIDRKTQLDKAIDALDPGSQAKARIDLTLVSVLLDAGAGPQWRYHETLGGQGEAEYVRSEGLAVASFHGFMQGCFSSDANQPCRVDAKGLLQLSTQTLTEMFQVSDDNPLVGLAGRATLLQRLGQTLLLLPEVFGSDARPGNLFDFLTNNATRFTLPAADVLRALLDYLSPIWLTGNELYGESLGDCWPHPLAGGKGSTAGWVPFHKLSQWLTYSLLEPFEWSGITLTDLDELTGLPEYRNGGLLLDTGVIVPLRKDFAQQQYTAADTAIIEWRALTVALIDRLAPLVRQRLGKTQFEMPLACILEGGTWAAGREIAKSLRPGGPPPLNIQSDGTVF